MDVSITQKFKFDGAITAGHKFFFDTHGFIHFKAFLNSGELLQVEQALESAYTRVCRERLTAVNGIPIRYGKNEIGETIVQRLPYVSVFTKKIEDVLSGKGINGLTGLVNRSDCRPGFNEMDGLVANYFINTPGSNYRQMGWHIDGLRDVLLMKPLSPMINVGIYLDDSGSANGGLRVLPGTHKAGLKSMLFRKLPLLDKREDKHEFLVEAEKGDMVLHDGRLWHRVALAPHTGSNGRRRILYVPLICGRQVHRNADSRTPFYQKLNRYARYQ